MRRRERAMPQALPRRVPRAPTRAASMRTILRTWQRRAPTARRTPISRPRWRVRAVRVLTMPRMATVMATEDVGRAAAAEEEVAVLGEDAEIDGAEEHGRAAIGDGLATVGVDGGHPGEAARGGDHAGRHRDLAAATGAAGGLDVEIGFD